MEFEYEYYYSYVDVKRREKRFMQQPNLTFNFRLIIKLHKVDNLACYRIFTTRIWIKYYFA